MRPFALASVSAAGTKRLPYSWANVTEAVLDIYTAGLDGANDRLAALGASVIGGAVHGAFHRNSRSWRALSHIKRAIAKSSRSPLTMARTPTRLR